MREAESGPVGRIACLVGDNETVTPGSGDIQHAVGEVGISVCAKSRIERGRKAPNRPADGTRTATIDRNGSSIKVDRDLVDQDAVRIGDTDRGGAREVQRV